MPADPKPARRIVDPTAGIEKLRRERICRVCGRQASGHPLDSLNRMHLVPKSIGGDDLDDNIVPGCGSGTTGCHGILTTHPSGWEYTAMRLRLHLSAAELAYVVAKKGHDWLNRAYPEVASMHTDGDIG